MRTQLDDLRSAEQFEGADIPTLIAERDECRRVLLPVRPAVGCMVVLKGPSAVTAAASRHSCAGHGCPTRLGSPQAMPQDQLCSAMQRVGQQSGVR